MGLWIIRVELDDGVALAIGRHVIGNDAAPVEQCQQAFGAAMPQFVARSVAARYAEALSDRALERANDFAVAAVDTYPPGFDPGGPPPDELVAVSGPDETFTTSPAAEPSLNPAWVPEPPAEQAPPEWTASATADLHGVGLLQAVGEPGV